MTPLDPQALDQLASEYVLGTLSADERIYVTGLMRSNPDLRQRVRIWEERLNPLASAVPPVKPPAKVWRAIAQKISAEHETNAGYPHRLWWPPLLAAAAGLLLGLSVMWLPLGKRVPESYVGVLSAVNNPKPVLHASALRHDNQLYLKMITPQTLAADQVLVLWALPENGPPQRIGIVQAKDKSVLTLSAEAEVVFKGITTLAVSAESIARLGSSTAQGEFLLKGPCVKLW